MMDWFRGFSGMRSDKVKEWHWKKMRIYHYNLDGILLVLVCSELRGDEDTKSVLHYLRLWTYLDAVLVAKL